MKYMKNSLRYLVKTFIGLIFVLVLMHSNFPGFGPVKVFGDEYSITVNKSGGDSTCTANASKSHAAKDEVITITATPGPGYRFVSWSCAHVNNISNNEQASTQLTMPPSDVTVTAIFEANPTYTITFDPNGSGATVTPTSGTTGTNGKLTSLPTPEWRGHAFDGWYTQATGGTQVTTSTVFSAGDSVYAHWHDAGTISYDVTLKVKNGSWDDGSKTDKTVNLWKYDNEDLALILTDNDIPPVGNEPDNGFTTGAWDTDPKNQTITSDRTFTYTYIKSRGIIQNYAAVLGSNVNTESSPTVMYGVYGGNPCSWRVIGYDIYGNEHAKKSGAMTLFASDYIGNETAFSTTSPSNPSDYGQSDKLKPFINDIYSGFNDKEKPAIINRELSDIPTHLENTDAQPLWPLSVDESSALPSADFRKTSGEYNHWWLRTQGTGSDVQCTNFVADVNGSTGEVQPYGSNPISNYTFRARPAFYLDLQEILFISAPTKAGGGKASNTVGKGALKEVASYTGTSWKLTLKDDGTGIAAMDGHAGFSAALTDSTAPVKAGEDISVDYSGAVANASGNEYVSAMLCDSDGKDVLYYGRLKQIEIDNDTSGTLPVTIPASVAAGDYKLKIFSEQYNGDNMTDLASNVISIDLTVLAAHKHSFTSHVTKPATCTETGVMTYTCSCGYSYTSSIPIDPDNHDFDEGRITAPATVLADGVKTYTCKRCGATKNESIPKLEPATEEDKELASQMEQLLEDLKGDDGELKVEVDIKTEKKEDGTVETVVTIGGDEIVKIITDEDGDETIESEIWSIGGEEDYTYTGEAIKPDVTVYDGLKKLGEGSDYTLKYANNVNAGNKATVTVNFTGGYKGSPSIKVPFTINQADLSKDVTAQDMILAVNGKLQKPVPAITMTASGLNIGSNVLKYRYLDEDGNVIPGIKDAGTYTVQAKAKKDNGNFTGIASVTVTVKDDNTKLLSNAKVNLTKNKYLYTGAPIVPEKGTYTLTLDGTELEENVDYTIALKNNVEPGKATIIFNAVENEKGLAGSTKATFEITGGRVLLPEGEGSAFTYSYEKSVPYEKAGVKPKVTVCDGDAVLIEGKDYVVGYKHIKAVAADNATDKNGKDIAPKIIVTGKNNYGGSVTLPFAITGKDIDSIKGDITVDDKAESNKGYKDPKITVYDGGKALRAKTDFEIDPNSYKVTAPGSSEAVSNPESADAGSIISVDILGNGNYTGSTTVTYRYMPAASVLKKTHAAKIAAKAYTGRTVTLTKKELNKLLYTGGGKNKKYLKYGEDFEIVRYEKNIKPGTAKVILRGINDHSGLRTVTFKINAAKKKGLIVLIKGLFNL